MADLKILTYDKGGVPQMLSGIEEVRDAIASGDITGDTPVTVYLDDNSRNFGPAEEQAGLVSLFNVSEASDAADEVEAGASEPIDTPEESDAESREEWHQNTYAEPSEIEEEPEKRPAPKPQPVTPPPPPPPPPAPVEGPNREAEIRNKTIGATLGVVGLLGFAIFLFNQTGDGDSYEATAEVAAEGVMADAEDVADEAAFATEGAADAMEEVEPVGPLDPSTGGEFRMLRGSTLQSRPDTEFGSPIKIGAKVFVDGTVDGYASASTEDGRSGYINWADINGNPYLTQKYRIKVVNRCPISKSLLFVWRQNGVWQIDADNTLTVPALRTWTLAKSGTQIEADRLEMYYYPITPKIRRSRFYPNSRKTVMVNGEEKLMLTAIPVVGNDGNATLTFERSDC